jgi:hypothetical protein
MVIGKSFERWLFESGLMNYPEYTSVELPKPDKKLPKDANFRNS